MKHYNTSRQHKTQTCIYLKRFTCTMNKKVLLLILTLFSVTECKLPDYIKVCQGSDPNLDDCIIKSVYGLVPKLKTGIPELHVPPIEPFHIKNTGLNSGSGGVHIGAILKDILVWNASSFKILDMSANIPKNYFDYNVLFPQLHLTGNYEIDTKILLLRLTGKGPFNINVTDVRVGNILEGKRIVANNGVKHLKFDAIKLNITVGGAQVKLENLFNGDPLLGKATNDVINDNVDIFYQALKPAIEDALQELFTESANGITEAFEYDELFPK